MRLSKDWIGRVVFVAVVLLCLPGSWVSSPIAFLSADRDAELFEADFFAPDPFNAVVGLRTVQLPFGKAVRFDMRTAFAGIYPSGVAYRGTPGATFLAIDPKLEHAKTFTLGADGRAIVTLHEFGHFSLLRLAYAALFAVLAMIVVPLVPWRHAWTTVRAEAGFAVVAAAILAVQYALVFPGIFNGDIVLPSVNADSFTTWYSALFHAYNYLFVFIGFDLIQLPCVLASLGIVMLLNHHLRPGWIGKALLLLVLATNPFLFAATFAGQRYFVAALLALLGLTLLFCSRRSAIEGRLGTYLAALAVLASAGLMRPEYWLFWLIGLAYGVAVFLRGHPRWPLLTGAIVGCTALAFVGVNTVLPLLHRNDPRVDGGRYQMTLLVDLAAPYACAGDAELAALYEQFGPVSALCTDGSERFYWDRIAPSGTAAIDTAAAALRGLLIARLRANPMPEIQRIATRSWATLNQDIWQVFNKYDLRDGGKVGGWAAVADGMGIVHDWPEVRPLHDALIALMRELGNPRYLLLVFALGLVVVSVPMLFVTRRPLAAIVGLGVLAVAAVGIVLSPIPNWAYVVMVPLWATYLVPLALVERR